MINVWDTVLSLATDSLCGVGAIDEPFASSVVVHF